MRVALSVLGLLAIASVVPLVYTLGFLTATIRVNQEVFQAWLDDWKREPQVTHNELAPYRAAWDRFIAIKPAFRNFLRLPLSRPSSPRPTNLKNVA